VHNRTPSRIDQLFVNKTNLSKFKRLEIISTIFSDHCIIKLQINNRIWKIYKHLEIKQHAPELAREKNEREISKIILRQTNTEKQLTTTSGMKQ
jgi:hypothetical protein